MSAQHWQLTTGNWQLATDPSHDIGCTPTTQTSGALPRSARARRKAAGRAALVRIPRNSRDGETAVFADDLRQLDEKLGTKQPNT